MGWLTSAPGAILISSKQKPIFRNQGFYLDGEYVITGQQKNYVQVDVYEYRSMTQAVAIALAGTLKAQTYVDDVDASRQNDADAYKVTVVYRQLSGSWVPV